MTSVKNQQKVTTNRRKFKNAKEREAFRAKVGNEFRLNSKQMEALTYLTDKTARHTLLLGGARSGKTFLIVRVMLLRALLYPNSRHLSLRLHRTSAEKYLWKQTLKDVIEKCFPDVAFVLNNSRLTVTCPNGSTYWFGGLDEGDKGEGLLGSDWNTIHYDEISEMPIPMVMQSRTRLSLKSYNEKRTKECINRTFATINPTFVTSPVYKMYIAKFNVERNLPMDEDTASLYNSFQINPVDNLDNISKEFIRELQTQTDANQRRFLNGEWSQESKDALFKLSNLNKARVPTFEEAKQLQYDKVVVSVDPSVTSGEKADETGIVVVGWVRPRVTDLRSSGDYYIIADYSLNGTPEEWAQAAYKAYVDHRADMIVGERNNGGDLVELNLRSISRTAVFKSVWASRGKAIRAEPVVSLSEKGDLHIVVSLPELEEEMTTWNPDPELKDKQDSPNRLDAMVWGVIECMGESFVEARVWGSV